MGRGTTILKSFSIAALLVSASGASFLVFVIFLVAPSPTLMIEILKISATSTITIIGLGLVAIVYAKGVLVTKYFGLETFELQEQVSSYVIDVMDFFRGEVIPLIHSSEESKAVDAKIEALESQLTDAITTWNNGHGDLRPTFDVLHEADTKMLIIEFADLLHRCEDEDREEWNKLLNERNKLHERHWPLLKRLSNFSDIRRIVSPKFLLIMVLGIIEVLSAVALLLSVNVPLGNQSYLVYAFHFFLMFYVLTATIDLLWEFLKW